MNLIDRKTDRATFTKFMSVFPVTAILGPRQCGKTTLARTLAADSYFDLDEESLLWRNQYVTTFLERDIPQLGITIPARTLLKTLNWNGCGSFIPGKRPIASPKRSR